MSVPAVVHAEALPLVRPESLEPFFGALRAMEGRQPGDAPLRVRILHLGDSHLQGDQFSHPLRLALQRRFGDAGRGVFFPYQVAHSTDAWDLDCDSNVKWASRRNAVGPYADEPDLQPGLSGFALLTRDPGYVLKLGFRGSEARFDTLTIFGARDARAWGYSVNRHPQADILEREHRVPRDRLHQVQPRDTLYSLARVNHVSVAQLRRWNHLTSDAIYSGDDLVVAKDASPPATRELQGFEELARVPGGAAPGLSVTVRLPALSTAVFLRALSGSAAGGRALFYGFSAERDGASGVIYDSIGVNGAKLSSFAEGGNFIEQARCLQPDLLVLSFGTNESMGGGYSRGALEHAINRILLGLERGRDRPLAVLLMTPPDVLRWSGRPNPMVARVADDLRQAAAERGLALWDWQAVMGGPGSVGAWRSAGLVKKDGVHMTRAGYELQSRLFFQALMDAYERR